MGRSSRLHKQAVINGTEKPFRQPGVKKESTMRCNVCGNGYPEHVVLDHVKECWGKEYTNLDEIPNTPPPEAYMHYQIKHPRG